MNLEQLDEAKEIERQIKSYTILKRACFNSYHWLKFIYHKKILLKESSGEISVCDEELQEIICNYCNRQIDILNERLKRI